MQKFDSNQMKSIETHKCTSIRTGEWIVYHCPKCPDYERRINWRTGKMKTRNIRANINHTGAHVSMEYLDAMKNVN
ncbi:hypothetical protein GF337_01480 [candidate division KSB1 bacterium]|nr:hypothetical protein [candidate division KSB1 bacterium]